MTASRPVIFQVSWHAGAIIGHKQTLSQVQVTQQVRIQGAQRWRTWVTNAQDIDRWVQSLQSQLQARRQVLIDQEANLYDMLTLWRCERTVRSRSISGDGFPAHSL
jgi:hypothetical protein